MQLESGANAHSQRGSETSCSLDVVHVQDEGGFVGLGV